MFLGGTGKEQSHGIHLSFNNYLGLNNNLDP